MVPKPWASLPWSAACFDVIAFSCRVIHGEEGRGPDETGETFDGACGVEGVAGVCEPGSPGVIDEGVGFPGRG